MHFLQGTHTDLVLFLLCVLRHPFCGWQRTFCPEAIHRLPCYTDWAAAAKPSHSCLLPLHMTRTHTSPDTATSVREFQESCSTPDVHSADVFFPYWTVRYIILKHLHDSQTLHMKYFPFTKLEPGAMSYMELMKASEAFEICLTVSWDRLLLLLAFVSSKWDGYMNSVRPTTGHASSSLPRNAPMLLMQAEQPLIQKYGLRFSARHMVPTQWCECVCVCMYVCMYVCIYVYIYIYIYIYGPLQWCIYVPLNDIYCPLSDVCMASSVMYVWPPQWCIYGHILY